ncbi:unnamed protein product [Blepharisma stoltei]|uniref:Ubiquitin fusion degradation protein UFD1 N-terminal subdomain 1 domain-containing protein n=1 Tax=Blepharisma stoltei TaxID=1481888 RepID=A0AAU9JMX0_9CILI|nr:unnamed protein product [Blepharisma stoltei]
MSISSRNKSPFSKQISNILLISSHPSYTQIFEYADKVIIPKSVFQGIRRVKCPFPPVILLTSLRYKFIPVQCGCLEDTCQEDYIYCPLWIMNRLGFRSKHNTKCGILLEILPLNSQHYYIYPSLSIISIYVPEKIDEDEIKHALMNYTVARKEEWIKLFLRNKEVKVYIADVCPGNISIINSADFEILFVEEPSSSKTSIRERLEAFEKKHLKVTENFGIPDLPLQTQKLCFLNSFKKNLKKKGRKSKNIKEKLKPTPTSLNVKRYSIKKSGLDFQFSRHDFTDSTLKQYKKHSDIAIGTEIEDLFPLEEVSNYRNQEQSRNLWTRESVEPFDDAVYFLKGTLNAAKQSSQSPTLPALKPANRPYSITPTRTVLHIYKNRSVTPTQLSTQKQLSLNNELYFNSFKNF